MNPMMTLVILAMANPNAVAVEAALFDGEDAPQDAFAHYGREKMGVLSRYETTLERSLYKALHELQRLQAARDGGFVPAPAVADVEVSFSGGSAA